MSTVTLHNINYHQNSTVTYIAKIFSLLVCIKSLQYMTIVMVLTIVIYDHDSRIVMSQNVTIAHLQPAAWATATYIPNLLSHSFSLASLPFGLSICLLLSCNFSYPVQFCYYTEAFDISK